MPNFWPGLDFAVKVKAWLPALLPVTSPANSAGGTWELQFRQCSQRKGKCMPVLVNISSSSFPPRKGGVQRQLP